jgi:hypothetical protein
MAIVPRCTSAASRIWRAFGTHGMVVHLIVETSGGWTYHRDNPEGAVRARSFGGNAWACADTKRACQFGRSAWCRWGWYRPTREL